MRENVDESGKGCWGGVVGLVEFSGGCLYLFGISCGMIVSDRNVLVQTLNHLRSSKFSRSCTKRASSIANWGIKKQKERSVDEREEWNVFTRKFEVDRIQEGPEILP